MKTLHKKDRIQLQKLAHHLEPVVMVGKQGVTENLTNKVNEALLSHELIKVKFIDHKNKKNELLDKIVLKTGCQVVAVIGHVAILYREHPDIEKRKIKLTSSE